MEITRKYLDKKYVPDYSNQLKAIELAKTKEATIKKFLIIGSILFALGLLFLALKFSNISLILFSLFGIGLIIVFLFCVISFPKINCSKCHNKMKKKRVYIGGDHAVFLVCENCKLY